MRGIRFWLAVAAVAIAALALAALLIWRDDILEALLDPEIPYAVYKPPPAPDYRRVSAWAMLPTPGSADNRAVDVFFVHPTTFDGGKDWNGPIDDPDASRLFNEIMAPNYAAPFAGIGRVFAPRYRQASLYTSRTLFDDAIEARQFAYGDIRAAFDMFRDRLSQDRPFILVGVEQGGGLAARLLREEIAADASVRRRLVGAYLIESAEPAADFAVGQPIPACQRRDQAGCVVAWISVRRGEFGRATKILSRAVVWNEHGRLVSLAGRPALCVNPLLGEQSDEDAPPRLNLGAANASGLEWGARPGFMVRQVGAQCVAGVLRVTKPRSASLEPSGGWADRLRAAPYNLFWADLEADAQRRAAAWTAVAGVSPPR